MSDLRTDPARVLPRVGKLTEAHDCSALDCGRASLNDWLKRFALTNQQSDAARTYVVHRAGRVVGYYALAAGAVRPEESPARIAKGLARHPIGVVLLARLAVDRREQGTGLGRDLLADALMRAVEAADVIGARAILVHALDEHVVTFYKAFGFEPSPLDPRQLMLMMKDARSSVKAGNAATASEILPRGLK